MKEEYRSFFEVVKFTLYPPKTQCIIVDKRIDVMVILRSSIAKNGMIINSMWKSFYYPVLLKHYLFVN